jgi:C-terminal peptidase prc
MNHNQLGSVVRYLRTVSRTDTVHPRSDRQLLDDFNARRDETAFEELVRRYGPMVLGVCRRILNHPADAEDAFQATFLVLVRKAHRIRKGTSVASWLYCVAYRTAARARGELARRRKHEKRVIPMTAFEPVPEETWRELRPILDEEVSHLPAKYREPVVLCYLHDLTYEEAAVQLGWPKGTVATRLARARELLRAQLTRRGIALSAGAVAVVMAPHRTAAAVPARLLRATVDNAVLAAAGQAPAAAAASTKVAALSQGVLGTMMRLPLKTTLAVLLTLGLAAAGGTVFLQQLPADQAGQDAPRGPAPAAGKEPPGTAPNPAAKAKPETAGKDRADQVALFARKVWTITDLVLQNHLEPGTRPDMLLGAIKGLLQAVKAEPPADLTPRVCRLENAEQFATLLKDLWPRGDGASALAPEKLERALLEGLFKAIPGDPDFIPTHTLKQVTQTDGNRYIGIGVQLKRNEDEDYPQIVNPFRRGVAHQAGARPGDLITEANGKSTKGVELAKVVESLRGEEGTTLTLVVRQPGATETRTLRLIRSVVPFDTVFGFRREGDDAWDYRVAPATGIGYVRINGIRSSTLHELRKIEPRLRAAGVRALVIDLRSVGGAGFLHTATVLADGLLGHGLLWRVRGTHGQVKEYHAGGECVFREWPLAVLVNDLTDRTHGAVLATLQDHRRAVLVGESTKVDGYGDTLLDMPDGQGVLRVRSFRIERPAPDRGWPVKPDHEVRLNDTQRKAVLKWLADKELPELPSGTPDTPPEDPQLAKAVELLRAALKTPTPSGK